ncbi:MAG: hypothetical protein JW820_16860 [Spirochaetales bacterium]|nr:hypothetical protein [Spirochaetales bacterium]
MLEKTKLEEISLELPEPERRELLARITRSLGSGARDDLVRVELKQEEREKLLAEEMQALTGWDRLLLWLKRLFSGRSRRELFIDWKIGQLKRRVKSRSPGLTGFETRDLSPRFACALYELYSSVVALRGSFEELHGNAEFRDRAVLYLVERRYPDVKKGLEELVPREEMEGIYSDSGSEQEVRKLCLRRLEEYLRRIPDRVMHQLDEGMKPFFYLKNPVLFPYAGIFRQFKVDINSAPDGKAPEFQPAAAMLVLDQLERLHHCVSLPAELGAQWFCHEEVFQCYLEQEGSQEERSEQEPEVPAREEETQSAASLSSAVVRLVEETRRFESRIPLLDLIRYFRKDPYYRLMFAVPRFHVKPAYSAALKSRVLAELEREIDGVKKSVLERKLAEVFKGERFMELFHYVDRPDSEYRSLDLPVFGHTTSLKVLYNYLSRVYRSSIQEVVQVANMNVLSGNRIAQARLNQHAAGLEELEARIVLLDRSLSLDEDDGKTLQRLRHRLATDLNQQRQYRGFVADKDQEALELIEQGSDYLTGIKRTFEELLSSPVESVKSVLQTLHFFKGRSVTLSGLLRSTADLIGDFLGLLSQLLALEKGD